MFSITTFDLTEENYKNWELPFDYHCLYILENGKEAYIGETNNSIRRIGEHLGNSPGNKKKYQFKRAHVITGLLAEATPMKHYENLLIRLMKVDNKFHIVNGDDGVKQHYYRKNEFELYFDQLWLLLEEKGLVKTKEFESIINSNIYKYSPHTILTEVQHNTLTSIVHTLDSGEMLPFSKGYMRRPILIKGDAGAGKTVVATSLFYHLRQQERYMDKEIALVYANPSTRYEIQEVFKHVEGLYKKDVISPIELTKRHYDIVICDETQSLRQLNRNLGVYYKNLKKGNERLGLDNTHDELDWILNNSTYQILFYDEKQVTGPCNISKEKFEGRLLYDEKRGVRPIELNEQMRIKAGEEYVPYIYDVLYQRASEKKQFQNYEFRLFDSFPEMADCLREKAGIKGLSRFCTGYAWEWSTREDETLVDISIEGVNINWNSQTKGWLSNPETENEMGSIYTVPGLDLNYAGVVIGPDVWFDKKDNRIKINRENFYDHKVKDGIGDKELKEYILNTYAIFLTRGILGTYIYVFDEDLREYLRQYI